MKPNLHSAVAPAAEDPESHSAPGFAADVGRAIHQAIARTSSWLLEKQHSDGHWVAELEGDTILESEYILLRAFLGTHTEPLPRKAARYLLEQQLATGGWTTYPGGRVDTSASVKAYFALKLTGEDPDSEPMRRARA